MAWKFERIGDIFDDVLDGPLWDGSGLLFCKVLKSEILRLDGASGRIERFRNYTMRNSGLTIGPSGNLYGAQSGARRIVWYKKDGSTSHLGAMIGGARHNHPHHVVCDSKNRIWFSDPYSELRTRGPQIFPPLPHCSILQMHFTAAREWHIRRMTHDTVEPRGLTLSPDERTLYVADSSTQPGGTRQIKAYPIGDHELGAPVVLHTFGSDHRGAHRGGAGLCTDTDGNILVAAGSRKCGPGPLIYVLAPSGQVIESHVVPGEAPTACAFGGADLGTLYVTTEDGQLLQVRGTGRKGIPRPARAA